MIGTDRCNEQVKGPTRRVVRVVVLVMDVSASLPVADAADQLAGEMCAYARGSHIHENGERTSVVARIKAATFNTLDALRSRTDADMIASANEAMASADKTIQ